MNFSRYLALFFFVFSMFLVVGCEQRPQPTLPAQVVSKYVSDWSGSQQRYIYHYVVVRDSRRTYTIRIRSQEYETIQIGEVWGAVEETPEVLSSESINEASGGPRGPLFIGTTFPSLRTKTWELF